MMMGNKFLICLTIRCTLCAVVVQGDGGNKTQQTPVPPEPKPPTITTQEGFTPKLDNAKTAQENPPKPDVASPNAQGNKNETAAESKLDPTAKKNVLRDLIDTIVEKVVADIAQEDARIVNSSEALSDKDINKRLRAAAYKSVKETVKDDLKELARINDDPKVTSKIIQSKLHNELRVLDTQQTAGGLASRSMGKGRKAAAELASKFMRSVLMG